MTTPDRDWQFLDEAALKQVLSGGIVMDMLANSSKPEAGERAVRHVRQGFARLLAQQRPAFVLHEQPSRQDLPWLLNAWWCTGLVDVRTATVVVVFLPQAGLRTLDATIERARIPGSPDLVDSWLAIGTRLPDGTMEALLRTVGGTLLGQWLKNPDHPHHQAVLDLGDTAVQEGLRIAFVAWERTQLVQGLADDPNPEETRNAPQDFLRATRARL